jgi:mannose-6-phosphate isomerase-like protein (cupin superfamily)
MTSPILVSPLLGNTIGSTDGFVAAEWKDPGGSTEERRLLAPLHLHHNDDEIWYVLEGTLCVQIGENEIEAHAGAAVMGPRGMPHTFWNPGPDPVRYLVLMTPNTYNLIQEMHETSDRSTERLRNIFAKYDCELLEG